MTLFNVEAGEIADKNPSFYLMNKAFLSMLCRLIPSGDISLYSHFYIKHTMEL